MAIFHYKGSWVEIIIKSLINRHIELQVFYNCLKIIVPKLTCFSFFFVLTAVDLEVNIDIR